jgi:hypothetical protein
MHPTEHPLHSKTEIRLQWIAIFCMAIGLITSIYYHSHTIKADRIKNEMASYLHLNDRYNKLLFTFIQNDADAFQKTDKQSLQENKYLIYELFELFATIDSFQDYFIEIEENVWPIWEKRMEFLFSKPAVRYAWESTRSYADKIYPSSFVDHVEKILSKT